MSGRCEGEKGHPCSPGKVWFGVLVFCPSLASSHAFLLIDMITLPPEPLMMLMMHHSPPITSLTSQHPKNNSFSLPPDHLFFSLSPTRLWVSLSELTHFVRTPTLQPSLSGYKQQQQHNLTKHWSLSQDAQYLEQTDRT